MLLKATLVVIVAFLAYWFKNATESKQSVISCINLPQGIKQFGH